MDFSPDKTLGLRLGGALGLGLLALMALAVYVLLSQPVGALALVPVSVLAAAGALLGWVGDRLYSLWTARYALEAGALTVQWGRRRSVIALDQIEDIHWGQEYDGDLRPTGLHWPGLVVSRFAHPALGAVEYLATTAEKPGLVLLGYSDGWLVLSPPEPQALIEALKARKAAVSPGPAPDDNSSAAAPLGEAPAVAAPPRVAAPRSTPWAWETPAAWPLWRDRWALGLLALGGLALAALAVYLAAVVPGLPAEIALRFNAEGQPVLIGPSAGLWVLPGVGVGIWLLNAVLGAWLHRRPADRALAYVLFLATVLAAGLAWTAALLLLTAGR